MNISEMIIIASICILGCIGIFSLIIIIKLNNIEYKSSNIDDKLNELMKKQDIVDKENNECC
jgi:hypothetical protein